MKPTKKQVKEEIKNLKSIVDKIWPFSVCPFSGELCPLRSKFGDDNRAKAHAAIEVMKKDMDEDAIYQAWPDDEEGDKRYNDEREAALSTRQWLDGEGDEGFSPYNDFKGLVQ